MNAVLNGVTEPARRLNAEASSGLAAKPPCPVTNRDDGTIGAAHLIRVKPLRKLGYRLSAHVVFHVAPAALADKPDHCATAKVLLFTVPVQQFLDEWRQAPLLGPGLCVLSIGHDSRS